MSAAGYYAGHPDSSHYHAYNTPHHTQSWSQSPAPTPTYSGNFSPSMTGAFKPSKPHFEPLIQEHSAGYSRPSRLRSRVGTFIYDWRFCILSICISVIALTATAALLLFVDQKPLPKLPLGLTVNTCISLFTTISKASLLATVAESISQLKWLWFRQPRILQDIQIFDDASRGPMGAARLLLKTRGVKLAALGGLITILSLVMEPFAQQILSYPERSVQINRVATVKRARGYDAKIELESLDNGLLVGPEWGMKAAIYDGIFSPQRVEDLVPTCETGNCTFPLFDSLAFCSKCLNVTDEVVINTPQSNPDTLTGIQNISYRIPGGANINFSVLFSEGNLFAGPSTISASVLPANTSNDVLGLQDPLLMLAVLQFTNVRQNIVNGNYYTSMPVTHECAIYFCVNTYNITVVNTITNTTILESWTSDTGTPTVGAALQPDSMEGTQDAILQRPSSIQGTNDTYIIPAGTLAAVKSWLNVTMEGTFNTSFSVIKKKVWADDDMQALDATRDWSGLMASIATAMTTYIRDPENTASVSIVNGAAHRMETYIRVNWVWLILPAALVGSSIVFLITTMVENESKRAMAWKSSSLALLFHGLEGVGRGAGDGLGQMRNVARKTRVVLTRGDEGQWKLINTG